MRNHFGLGRLASMTFFFFEGLIGLINCLITNTFTMSMNVYFALWLTFFILLHFVKTDTEYRQRNYFIIENTILTVMSAWRANDMHNVNALFVMLLCVWLINIIYLNKHVYKVLIVENVIVFSIFTFANKIWTAIHPDSALLGNVLFINLEIREFLNIMMALFLGMWVGSIISEDYQFLLRMQKEHNAGMDELFALVIEKFKDAKVANAAKTSFLANMSHEIRTPINAVLGLDTMILRETKEKETKAYAMDIKSAGQSLLSIINDVLDLTKIESGMMEIIPVEYDVSSLINDVVNMIQVKTQQKNLEFILDANENLPSTLYGDDIRIRQVLINILTNAAKYTEKGSVKLIIDFEKNGDDELLLHFEVQDTGIGIKKEDLTKLYSKFARIDELRNRNIEGTGLGINIVTSFLAMMDSELKVTSEYGKGSNFSFDLKQKIINDEPIGNLADRIREQAQNYDYEAPFIAPDARILVVDDNSMNRVVFVGLVKELEIPTDEAGSGFECLEMVAENKYDIIFMDHMMPKMDGIETFQHIREDKDGINYNTPVVILTANAVVGAKEMYMEKGFSQYLSKPVVPEKLEECIRDLLPLEKKQPAPERATAGSERGMEAIDLSQQFPSVEGMDWNYGYMHLKDVDLLRSTVTGFVNMINSEADYLQDCYRRIQDGDIEAVNDFRIKVHAMKSSATLIGALPLSGMAASLEYASRDGNLDFVKSVAPHFIEEWKGYREKLICFLPEEGNKKTYDNADTIAIYFEKLNSLMECFDVDGADEALGQIKEYDYPEAAIAVLEKITGAVMNLDADYTKALSEEFMGIIRG